MKNFIKDLYSGDMIKNIIPGTENYLKKNKTSIYVGIDPTFHSLHIGHLPILILLKKLQLLGYKPIVLIGGATALIGDPSGKLKERQVLGLDKIIYNQSIIKKQILKIFNFIDHKKNLEILNNYTWMKKFNFLSFLKNVGKNISISYMISKDSVKNRLKNGISFSEFSYQLIQGYDFYYLFKNKNVRLQIGGSDQWGNIITGIDIIKRKIKSKAYAITLPLLTKSDGSKFGKTDNKNIWLDSKLTSSYQLYQFFINCSDYESEKLIKNLTFYNKREIEEIIKFHKINSFNRILQKSIAKSVMEIIYSKNEYNLISNISNILFGNKNFYNLELISSNQLNQIFSCFPVIKINKNLFFNSKNVLDLVCISTNFLIFKSKSEAKKMIKNLGLKINKITIKQYDEKPNFKLLKERYLLIQKGKKDYYIINLI